MKVRYEYSKDYNFLKQFDMLNLKEKYVKITILNWAEEPLQEIQGITTGGNLNLDGQSAVRRTCNLSFCVINDNYDITNVENLFSLNKKIYLEIGIKNNTNQYKNHEIIWFPQGVFVMINPSISHDLNGMTISMSCRDKMCLLNGEVGGIIPAAVQLDSYESVNEDGMLVITKPVITQIIRELVNHLGGEQLSKIIISDIDDRIKKVVKWVSSSPVYLISNQGSYFLTTDEDSIGVSYKKYEYGEDIGYIYTDFVYLGDLIADAGSSICDSLDKIKNYLGNYEYFYDIDGNFIFQEKKNFLNTTQAKVELDKMKKEDYIIDISKGKSVYNFDNTNLITSYSNSPRYDMIKNDFVVWGIRKNASGNSVPIRYHLAIDSKPQVGNTYSCFSYLDPDDKLLKMKKGVEYSSYSELIKNPGKEGVYYITLDNDKVYVWKGREGYVEIDVSPMEITTKDWRTELYLSGVESEPLGIDSNYYYTELLNEWPKLYDVEQGEFYDSVLETPSNIDFFLDFIDSEAEISKFSVSNIGRRSVVINDNDINCIFEPDIPDFVLIENGQPDTSEKRQECENRGQKYIQVDSSLYSMIAAGGSLNSAYNRIRELLDQYTSYNESITIQTIPIYYLEPNSRITVRDINSNIYGDYNINSISIPLDIGGTMSISAIRATERL